MQMFSTAAVTPLKGKRWSSGDETHVLFLRMRHRHTHSALTDVRRPRSTEISRAVIRGAEREGARRQAPGWEETLVKTHLVQDHRPKRRHLTLHSKKAANQLSAV